MGPDQIRAVRDALADHDVVSMQPDHLDEGQTTDTLGVNVNGSVRQAVGELARKGVIPSDEGGASAPLVVTGTVLHMRGESPNRYEAGGTIILGDNPHMLQAPGEKTTPLQ